MDWDTTLNDILVPGIPLIEKIIRPILVYAFLVIALRIAGKRELAQMNPFDLVVLLTLSNTVQNAIIGNDNSVSGGIIGAITLLAANFFVVRFLYKHERVDRIVEGRAALLIDDGRIIRKNLERELITEEELLVACHRQGVEKIEQVEKAILETGGTITVFSRHPTTEESFDASVAERLAKIEQLLTQREQSNGQTKLTS